jgi:hypothetical protein
VNLLLGALLLLATGRQEYVRVTFYLARGHMASGITTYRGAAACSYGFPMGTRLRFPDGWTVTCLDRGLLGYDTGWVDVWAPSYAWGLRYIEGDYGRYAWVEVDPEEEETIDDTT